jgi:Na+/H+ antiporter NhaD/arsenite permease-like protein
MLLAVIHGPGHLSADVKKSAEFMTFGEKYAELDVFARSVNFDVIFTLAGMMILVNILSQTGFFQYIAVKCVKLGKANPVRVMILLVIATAVLSAFLDNVTTVLLIAPVTIFVASELEVPVLPFLFAETMASNIGGTATLVGDPPNLIIGSAARLDFMAFIFNLSPIIIVIMIVYCCCLKFYYGGKMRVDECHQARLMKLDAAASITDPVNMKRGLLVMFVTLCGFCIHGLLGIQPGVIALSGAALGLLCCRVNVDHALEKIEWSTLAFFVGLFVLVAGAETAGVMHSIGSVLNFTSGWHPLATILAVMWSCAAIAAMINNVSFTAVMVSIMASFLTVTPAFKSSVAMTELMWWGLALAVCLGGNGTIVGAAANLVTAGLAEKSGVKVTARDFFRYGFPVTLGSMVIASIYITIRYCLIPN